MQRKLLTLIMATGLSFNAMAANDTLVIATSSTVQTVNPHLATVTQDYSIANALYESLFRFDKDMNIVPDLALDYTISDEGKVYTINLRQQVKFTDGTPFNAQAVKFNFEYEIQNKLKHASLLSSVKSIEAVSDDTLVITLNQGSNNFINNLAHPSQGIISPKALEKYGKDINKLSAGTGRYQLAAWQHGSKVTLKANPNYWGGEPSIKQVEFRTVPEAGSRLAMLKSGQAQVMLQLPNTQKPVVVADNKLTVVSTPSTIASYYGFNVKNPILGKVKVRRALSYAIDRDAYIKVIYGGEANKMHSIIPSKIETYQAQTPFDYDVDKAKQLLSEAGYPNGFDVQIWSKSNTIDSRSAQFIQQQLSLVGIKAKIVQRDVASHYAALGNINNSGNTPAVILQASWSASSATADWSMRPLFQTGAEINFTSYSNPKLDQLFEQGQITLDKQQKTDIYQQIQHTVWEDAAAVWLTTPNQLFAKAKDVKGIRLSPDGAVILSEE
ncbi:ABC transporter substrate-binding protein [Vibrio gallicus]|uniref:ABC transporter substrate-binding protein n=1 Tax=Vibrio gallicus TaxID=190897 RepID=UPI0021C44617|nr:ABC transporter substrate-binding protein [Vibrio gallicus]